MLQLCVRESSGAHLSLFQVQFSPQVEDSNQNLAFPVCNIYQ
jgi:hypothetical protein